MHSRFFSAARLLLLATLLFAPLAFGAVQPWAWGTMGLLAILIFLLWSAGNLTHKSVVLTWSWLFVPAALLFVLAVIQLAAHFTVDPASTREAILKLAICLLLFFLTVQLYGHASRDAWHRLGLFVLLFASALALFGILQCFSSERMIYWQVKSPNDDFGPYVDRDHYAGLMEMLIPVAATYALSLKGGISRPVLATFGVLIAVVSLLLTGCRGGFLALLVEFVLFAVIAATLRIERKRFALVLTAIAMVAAATGLWLSVAPDEIPARLASIVRFRDPNVNPDRPEVSADTLRIFHDHLGVGVGLGAFDAIYPQYQSFSSEYVWDHAHDDYAELLAETGLPGALLAASGLLIFLYGAFLARLKYRTGDTQSWIHLGAALACCGLLVHSFFDFNLHIPANAAWFSVCAGLATIRGTASRTRLRARTEITDHARDNEEEYHPALESVRGRRRHS
ncbi:MAG: O-antigen ligase family protein [Bryobacteraceae bacterium]